MKSSPSIARSSRSAVGRRDDRVAGDGDERAHLALAGRLDLLGQARRPAARRRSRAARARGCASARSARPCRVPGVARRVALPGRGAAGTSRRPRGRGCRSARSARRPASWRACRTPACRCRCGRRRRPRGAAGQLARHAPDLAGLDAARARHALGREVAHERASTSLEAVDVLARARPGSTRPSSTSVQAIAASSRRVGAGADEVVLVGLLGGARAARVDHHDLAAALADARAAGRACRAPSAGCRSRRAGWRPGSAGGRCGRRPAPARDSIVPNISPARPAWASGRPCDAE